MPGGHQLIEVDRLMGAVKTTDPEVNDPGSDATAIPRDARRGGKWRHPLSLVGGGSHCQQEESGCAARPVPV